MDKVPLILQVVRRDDKGNGMVLSKEFGGTFVALEITDLKEQVTINLDFNKLFGMMLQIKTAEKKEKNKRVLLGL